MTVRPALVAVALLAATALSGCIGGGTIAMYSSSYSARTDAGYKLPSIPISRVPSRFHRQMVSYPTRERPGTIIVDTRSKYLFLVMENGKAMRYGIGVGREGFEWKGTARIAMKRQWPVWTPPKEMIERQPELAKYRRGMPPGTQNALGARALYLFNEDGDTGYRLHGTPEWNSIGKAMSSGCIRLINQDIIDLYDRAESGAKVIVI